MSSPDEKCDCDVSEQIIIPGRRKAPVSECKCVKVSSDAYNALIEIYNESSLSMKEIVSILILESAKRVTYER